jgi:hypothetical protein
MVGCLNSVWWDQLVTNKTEGGLGRCLVETVMMYGSEMGVENKSQRNKPQAVEMDYLQRTSSKSKSETGRNEEIRQIMQAEETVLDRIEIRNLEWFGHMMRTSQERWRVKIHAWIPPGRRQRGQRRWSWHHRGNLKRGGGWLQMNTGMDTLEIHGNLNVNRMITKEQKGYYKNFQICKNEVIIE